MSQLAAVPATQTFGTITLEELRIESFFPADQETEDAIQRLAQGG